MMRLIAVLGLLLISGLVSIAASPPATARSMQASPTATGDLVFSPVADARVEAASPSVNYGGSPRLRVDGGTDPAVESYLMFTVSDISGPIGRATLRVFATSDTRTGRLRIRQGRPGRKPGLPGPIVQPAPLSRLPARVRWRPARGSNST